MNKTIAIFLILLCLTVNASASCDVCKVTVIKVENVTYEDEIDIFVTFRNDGTEKCTYNVEVLDVFGNVIEYEPNTLEFWHWVKLEPEGKESATVELSSNWDFWSVCDLPSYQLGKGNYSIKIIGHNSHPTKCEYDGQTTPGLEEYYLFDTIGACCGTFEGISCLNYSGTGYGGFTCNDSVQINFGKDCLVYCWNDYDKDNCSCVLDAACAIKCISGTPSYCYFGDFICDGPYRCANGDTPEVRCSTTKTCNYQCAAKCGRGTTFTSDCESRCRSITCNKKPPYEPDLLAVCMDACVGLCRTHEELCNIIYILGAIAVASAAFLIMVHGVKWMTADDFEGRQNARRGITYVFIGLILVMTAAALASYFFTGSLVC